MLKRILVHFLCAAMLVATTGHISWAQPLPMDQEPAYAKWGKMAVLESKKKYPAADVVDYLHVGRKAISANVTQETFRLWLKQPGREFGVIVTITFDATTEQFKSIQFQEVSR